MRKFILEIPARGPPIVRKYCFSIEFVFHIRTKEYEALFLCLEKAAKRHPGCYTPIRLRAKAQVRPKTPSRALHNGARRVWKRRRAKESSQDHADEFLQ